MLVHHLIRSQSERIVWLCEELGLPYELKHYHRSPLLAPPELRAVHPMGAAPVIEEDGLMLAESAAIVDWIMAKHGRGRLRPGPDEANFADYLYWFHFANGNLQPVMGRSMFVNRLDLPAEHPMAVGQKGRLDTALGLIEQRLGTVDHLAGDFSAADIMTVFSLTTMRVFSPVDLAPYPHILAYLQRIGARPAYQRAMAAADPGEALLLT